MTPSPVLLVLVLLALAACGAPARTPPAAPVVQPVTPAPVSADRFVDGLRYQVHGDGPVTLVLVHGNFDRLETWDAIVPSLAGWARVVTLDLPGFGRSENRADDFSLYRLARGVERVVDAVGAERVVLVGNSLGGAVATTYATLVPERIAGLVLEDANFGSGEWPEPEAMTPLMALMRAAGERAAHPDEPAFADALRAATRAALEVALRRPGVVTDALVDHYVQGFEGAPWLAVKRVQVEVDHGPVPAAFVAARARRDFPVLLAWGLDDAVIPVRAAERIARTIPGARLWLCAGTGHGPHVERPAELAAAIRAAFGPGGALPADDVVVVPEGTQASTPWPIAKVPRLERAIRRYAATLGARQAADVAPWLAFDEIAVGDAGAAEAAVAPLAMAPTSALSPLDVARLELVRGLVAEARGEPAIEHYLAAAASEESWTRDTAIGRLALADLDDATAAKVDAAIGPLSDGESIRRRVARLDRALATHRYEDALAQFEGWDAGEPAFALLRRAMALLGAGRVDEIAPLLRPPTGTPPADDRHAALRRPLAGCRNTLGELDRAARGRSTLRAPECALPLDVATLIDTVPPPRLRDLSQPADPHAPLTAVALAMSALGKRDDAAARAALAAVPGGAAAQTPAYQRLRLALAASAGDRRAVAEARALVAAHGGAWPWRWALATTLHAAGKPAQAERELALVIALSGHDVAREELARVLADLGRVDEGKAILATLARAYDWAGTAPLPHQRRAAAKLSPPSAR